MKVVHKQLQGKAYHRGKPDLERLFGLLDKDGSGELSLSELKRAIRSQLKINIKDLPDASIELCFGMLDIDGGGSLEAAELKKFIREGPPWPMGPWIIFFSVSDYR